MNKLVARFADGQVLKGTTADFAVGKDSFHVTRPISDQGWGRTKVDVADLKAVFFVKDFDGDPARVDKMALQPSIQASERGVEVFFKDGEMLRGSTPRYRGALGGFFVVPADSNSNNLTCYVVEAATRHVRFISPL